MIQRVMAAAGIACVLAGASGRVDAATQATTVPVWGGSLVLTHPQDWKNAISGPLSGPTVKLTPGSLGDFQILITVVVSKTAQPTDEVLAKQVRMEGQGRLPTAAQTAMEVKPVKGAQARGYLYHLTDHKAGAGAGTFRELHQGTVFVGTLTLSVTILTHTPDTATVDAAFAALASARYNVAPKK